MRLHPDGLRRHPTATIATLLLAVALLLPARAPLAANGSANGAADFIEQLGQKAIEDLGNAQVPDDQRRAKFLNLLDRGFAVEAISRFVLGRYWRVASDQQQDRFQEVFKRIIAQRFLPLFRGYERDDFAVSGARPDPAQPNLYAVRTLVSRPDQSDANGQKVEVTWRVRPIEEGYEIVDIKAEGVSMAITLRSEYNAAIQRAGGNVGELIARLEQNLAEGAYAPENRGDLTP